MIGLEQTPPPPCRRSAIPCSTGFTASLIECYLWHIWHASKAKWQESAQLHLLDIVAQTMSHTYPHLNHMIPTGNLLLKSVLIRYTWRIGRRQVFDQRETPRPDSPVEAKKSRLPDLCSCQFSKGDRPCARASRCGNGIFLGARQCQKEIRPWQPNRLLT